MIKQKNTSKRSGKKVKISKKDLNDYYWAYFMIAPTIIGLIILNIWPLIQTIYLSFNKTSDFGINQWIGLDNYKQMFSDPAVWQATLNTLKYTAISVPIGVILSLGIAVLLNSKIKGKTIYRTIYFLPMVSAPAAIAMVWRWLYSSDFGLFNYLLSLVGIHGPNWLTNPKLALLSIIVVGIWSYLGYNMIILLAGLQEIPKSFYEAAKIDGAGPIRQFFAITFPLISPTMFFVVVTSMITGLQVFDLIFMMISKSNAVMESTQSLVYLFYNYSFVMNDKGYGSTIVVLLLAIILLITVVQLKLQKKWVHYE
ncbi:sugar ABC transporter permease [Clostridium estertheticum]|uniref:Sugar ABC transporter permease n=1 Tax=Clostridium estertheticum TaxID=238834 RepID=A0AA47EQY8_9CLOT|nr:sugar ABC transporter permease [Clostridium estertheticum]MBU3158028.1 sugar ABC transporter permease [Clostridium estertheticum]MBU3202394.1 sugar ABC transporter permease [Clostridium estertheticum]WAG63138.1 sugar ABC transporter permease [Clostridium estertheticum]WAG67981.1 sugar ABC transporter permease [Clostridium estertheticum]